MSSIDRNFYDIQNISSNQFILQRTTEVIDVCLGRLPSNVRNFYAHLISSKERANHKTFFSLLELLRTPGYFRMQMRQSFFKVLLIRIM